MTAMIVKDDTHNGSIMLRNGSIVPYVPYFCEADFRLELIKKQINWSI